MDKDQEILSELLDSIERLQQRSGESPEPRHSSSVRRLSEDLAEYADAVKSGTLRGRARKRKSGDLFRRIISLHPGIWKT